MPSDPFEAELLMMAEAVASADKHSDSDTDDDDNDDCQYISLSLLFFSLFSFLSYSPLYLKCKAAPTVLRT